MTFMQLKEERKATGEKYKRNGFADPVFGLREYVRMDCPLCQNAKRQTPRITQVHNDWATETKNVC
jgi:hypothetical protein